MSEEKDTIKISKSSLWKYSTFVLAIILIIGAFIFFSRGHSAVVTNGQATTGAAADLSVFLNNPNLYPSIGPASAPATVIEFADFQCPYCAIAQGTSSFAKQEGTGQYADLFQSAGKLEQLANAGKIRFIYVSMSFLGQESVNSAQAALCANDQGKFWQMHDALFAANDGSEDDGKYSVSSLETLAAGISGLDTTTFNGCLSSAKYASEVTQIGNAASSAGVQGTPTFYVNGQNVQAGWSTISAALSSAGVSTS